MGHVLLGNVNTATCVAWSLDGRQVSSGSRKTVRSWDVESVAVLQEPVLGHQDFVMFVAWSADGSFIALASHDRSVRVWNAESVVSVRQPLVGLTSAVCCVAWSGGNQRVLSAAL